MKLPKTTQPKIIAAIPCYNTERFIGEVAFKARKYVDQLIVVDDGSRDRTTEIARATGALVINHDTNRGYGEAIKSCFEVAKANNADVLVILDGDGQHNPDELPQVLAPILNGEADLVIGSRFLGEQGNMPCYRKFGIDVITFLYNFGSRVKVSDAQSGFRAYSRKVLGAFPLAEKGMGISIEVIIKAREKGLSINEVPISCLYLFKSSNLNPVVHGLGVALTVVRLRLKQFIRRNQGE